LRAATRPATSAQPLKTPVGWTFVRQLTATPLRDLPASTLTAVGIDQSDGSLVGRRYAQATPEAGGQATVAL